MRSAISPFLGTNVTSRGRYCVLLKPADATILSCIAGHWTESELDKWTRMDGLDDRHRSTDQTALWVGSSV